MTKVYIVGAGPGDAELITVKGLRVIREADVILYDRLINTELLKEARSHTELIFCGKSPDQPSLTQESINNILCNYALQGKVVTRLKGGDPFIFGRGGEEALELAHQNIPFEIVPGISSGSAAPAYAGIPLTHRGWSSSVSFITGVTNLGGKEEDYWENIAQSSHTLCIYMGVRNLPKICEKLMRYGRPSDTPIALVHWGTTEFQETVTGTLIDIVEKARGLKNPSMIVIGEVVNLRKELMWFEKQSEAIVSKAVN